MTQREIMEEIYQKLHDSDIEIKTRIANGENCSVFAESEMGIVRGDEKSCGKERFRGRML